MSHLPAMSSWFTHVFAVAACAACSHDRPEPLVPASREEPPPAQRQTQDRQEAAEPQAADPQSREMGRSEEPEASREGTLGLSRGIQERCKLPETRAGSPQFDFDESDLRPRGMNILDGVVACMKEGGALSSESINIVGHADPRGPNDYNRDLGMRRAEAARRYLLSKGIPESRIIVRSRGEAEAKGTDPSGWRLDRHVEIEEATAAPR